jgi:hypothetical protein
MQPNFNLKIVHLKNKMILLALSPGARAVPATVPPAAGRLGGSQGWLLIAPPACSAQGCDLVALGQGPAPRWVWCRPYKGLLLI